MKMGGTPSTGCRLKQVEDQNTLALLRTCFGLLYRLAPFRRFDENDDELPFTHPKSMGIDFGLWIEFAMISF